MQSEGSPSLYDRLDGVYSIATVVDEEIPILKIRIVARVLIFAYDLDDKLTFRPSLASPSLLPEECRKAEKWRTAVQ